MLNNLPQAVQILQEGGVIAYPTEGVFGLGCDPFNETAVLRLLKLKQRIPTKGLILLAADWQQVAPLVQVANLAQHMAQLTPTQEAPTTWLLPATERVPKWIRGGFASVAIRVTVHPVALELCKLFGRAVVSTSANPAGGVPLMTAREVANQFTDNLDAIVVGRVGGLRKPTTIKDFLTQKVLRA